MFRAEVMFRGSHALKIHELKDYQDGEKGDKRLFPRYIDVYMIAPLVGVIYGVKEPLCNENYPPRSIFAETIIKHYNELDMIYKLVMLFDEHKVRTLEDRIYRAFRDYANRDHSDNHTKNIEVFNSYVRGGISVLHEKIIKNAVSFNNYVDNYHKFIEEFKTEFINKEEVASIRE